MVQCCFDTNSELSSGHVRRAASEAGPKENMAEAVPSRSIMVVICGCRKQHIRSKVGICSLVAMPKRAGLARVRRCCSRGQVQYYSYYGEGNLEKRRSNSRAAEMHYLTVEAMVVNKHPATHARSRLGVELHFPPGGTRSPDWLGPCSLGFTKCTLFTTSTASICTIPLVFS